jgi:hypothetical protein
MVVEEEGGSPAARRFHVILEGFFVLTCGSEPFVKRETLTGHPFSSI